MKVKVLSPIMVGLLACAVFLPAGPAGARLPLPDADPVRLFAFDIDPECQSPDCVPEEGAFYPGRAEKSGARFTGESLQVPEGTDVEFTNISSEHHGIASFKTRAGRPVFESTEHVPQGTSSLLGTQFLRPGTYAYFCTHHPATMFGLIEIVRA